MATTRLQGLDGLRGIAILLVVSYHLWGGLSNQRTLPDTSLNVFLYAGNTGVTLFFVLSGFLVSLPFIISWQSNELYPLRRYALQRLLRILPPYYAVGLIGIIFTDRTEQFLPVIFFMADSFDVGYFSTVWWSLATEMQFYLILPLFFVAALSQYRAILLTLALGLAVAAYVAVIFKLIGPDGPEGFDLKFQLILSVIGQLPAFATGALLAVAHMSHKFSRIRQMYYRILTLVLSLLLAWALLPSARTGALMDTYQHPWRVLPQALLWGGILWLMLYREEAGHSLLDNRLTRYFGKISFSFYLLHMPILQLVLPMRETHGLWLSLAAAWVLSVAVAQLSYLLVEQPALNLKNTLSPSRTPSGISA